MNNMDGKKKRLLVTASTFPRWEGDTEPRFVLDLCKYMTAWFDVTVLVPYALGAKNTEVLEGVKVIRYHYFPIHNWETLCYPGAIVPRIREKKIRGFLVPFLFAALYCQLFRRLSDYDVVHAHWIIPQGIVQSLFKKPYIVTGHGGDVNTLNRGIVKKLKIRCLRKARHVTVVSDYLAGKIHQLAPGASTDVISMGVDAARFGKRYFVENYFGQGDRKVVLFVGRLVEEKGIRYLITAMRGMNALLVIAGDGPIREELENQAADMKTEVLFLGSKPHDELRTIYASADIFAAPFITARNGGQEGLGIVLLEAMASGLPVVANRSGGIPQLIRDGENGLLCEEKNCAELTEKLTLLLENESLRQRLVKNSRITVEKYDYRSLARRYAALINENL